MVDFAGRDIKRNPPRHHGRHPLCDDLPSIDALPNFGFFFGRESVLYQKDIGIRQFARDFLLGPLQIPIPCLDGFLLQFGGRQ